MDNVFIKRIAILKASKLHDFSYGVLFLSVAGSRSLQLGGLNRVGCLLSASLTPPGSCGLQPGQGTLLANITLKFGRCRDDMKHQLAGGAAVIKVFLAAP